jgi:hypothetical protein
MTNKFILNNFSLESPLKMKVYLEVDNREIQFFIIKEGLGYKIPGELENILTEHVKRSQNFIRLLDNWYNNLPIVLPVDLSFVEYS